MRWWCKRVSKRRSSVSNRLLPLAPSNTVLLLLPCLECGSDMLTVSFHIRHLKNNSPPFYTALLWIPKHCSEWFCFCFRQPSLCLFSFLQCWNSTKRWCCFLLRVLLFWFSFPVPLTHRIFPFESSVPRCLGLPCRTQDDFFYFSGSTIELLLDVFGLPFQRSTQCVV